MEVVSWDNLVLKFVSYLSDFCSSGAFIGLMKTEGLLDVLLGPISFFFTLGGMFLKCAFF